MPTFFPLLFGCCFFALKPFLPVLMFLPTCFCFFVVVVIVIDVLGVIRFICLLWQASCCWTVSLFIAFELNKLPNLPLCVEYPEQLICPQLQQKCQIKESYCFKRAVLYLYIVSITFATPYKYYGFVDTKTAPPKSTFKELLKPSWLHRLKAISHKVKEEIVTLHKY